MSDPFAPYQVGVYLDPGDDPKFDDEHNAIEYAYRMAVEQYRTAWCVWDRNARPVHLFYGGEQFRAV